jgi:hypothetical protein
MSTEKGIRTPPGEVVILSTMAITGGLLGEQYGSEIVTLVKGVVRNHLSYQMFTILSQ